MRQVTLFILLCVASRLRRECVIAVRSREVPAHRGTRPSIHWTNLTSPPGKNAIGHSEVPAWYLINIVIPGNASLVT